MTSLRLAVCLFLSAGAAFAQVRTWVSPTGEDSNPCTRELPCRNFAAAVSAVAANGEVVALDSAGYGPVTLTKSVTLLAPKGIHAAIAPASGIALSVNVPDGNVVLRNLYLNSQGAAHGVVIDAASEVHIENCVVSGFGINGVWLSAPAHLYLSQSMIRRCQTAIAQTAGVASIDSVKMHQNQFGLYVVAAKATVRNSVASGGPFQGFIFENGAVGELENCLAADYGTGFVATIGIFGGAGAVVSLSRCSANANGVGIGSYGEDSIVYVTDSTIAGNTTAIEFSDSGVVSSRGNNTMAMHEISSVFNGSFTAN